MSENKTKPTGAYVPAFLRSVEPPARRNDGWALLELMRAVTGEEPVMWGPSIVGFGKYHYRYESGREGDSFLAGFSPRQASLSVYFMGGFEGAETLLSQLGKYKLGKSCLYINKLDDVDLDVLRDIIERSVKHMREEQG